MRPVVLALGLLAALGRLGCVTGQIMTDNYGDSIGCPAFQVSSFTFTPQITDADYQLAIATGPGAAISFSIGVSDPAAFVLGTGPLGLYLTPGTGVYTFTFKPTAVLLSVFISFTCGTLGEQLVDILVITPCPVFSSSTLTSNPTGLAFTSRAEGYGPFYYLINGDPTIGYGHDCVMNSDHCTDVIYNEGFLNANDAAQLFLDDYLVTFVPRAIAYINLYPGVLLTQNQFNVMVDVAFNDGHIPRGGPFDALFSDAQSASNNEIDPAAFANAALKSDLPSVNHPQGKRGRQQLALECFSSPQEYSNPAQADGQTCQDNVGDQGICLDTRIYNCPNPMSHLGCSGDRNYQCCIFGPTDSSLVVLKIKSNVVDKEFLTAIDGSFVETVADVVSEIASVLSQLINPTSGQRRLLDKSFLSLQLMSIVPNDADGNQTSVLTLNLTSSDPTAVTILQSLVLTNRSNTSAPLSQSNATLLIDDLTFLAIPLTNNGSGGPMNFSINDQVSLDQFFQTLNASSSSSSSSSVSSFSSSTGLSSSSAACISSSTLSSFLTSSSSGVAPPSSPSSTLTGIFCYISYSLPGNVDYPWSVATFLQFVYDPTTVVTNAGVAVTLLNGTGSRTYTNRFGLSFSTPLTLQSAAGSSNNNLLYLSSSMPLDNSGLKWNLNSAVQLPGGGPSHLYAVLHLRNVSGVLTEGVSSRVDGLGQAFLSTVPGFENVTVGSGNINSLALNGAACRAPITFTNGLRAPTQPFVSNGATLFFYSYFVSDGASYSVQANLTISTTSAFATTDDMLGNPYQTITNVTGTRTYTYLLKGTSVTSAVTGLVSSGTVARFYPYSLLSSAPAVYTANNAPFLDADGVTFAVVPSVPAAGLDLTTTLHSDVSIALTTNQSGGVLSEAITVNPPLASLQRQQYSI